MIIEKEVLRREEQATSPSHLGSCGVRGTRGWCVHGWESGSCLVASNVVDREECDRDVNEPDEHRTAKHHESPRVVEQVGANDP